MSTTDARLVVGAVLVLLLMVGAASVFRAGRRSARAALGVTRDVTRFTASVFRTVVTTVVIVGVQWVVVTHATDLRVMVVTLAVPAVFAGASVARLLSVRDLVRTHRHGGFGGGH